MQNVWGEKMKEVLESLQVIDKNLDDCRYFLSIHEDEELFNKLNEMSKEVKTLINKVNQKGGDNMGRTYEELRDRVIEDVSCARELILKNDIIGGLTILTGFIDSLENEKEIELNASDTNENI